MFNGSASSRIDITVIVSLISLEKKDHFGGKIF